jgi:hypothetical protein
VRKGPSEGGGSKGVREKEGHCVKCDCVCIVIVYAIAIVCAIAMGCDLYTSFFFCAHCMHISITSRKFNSVCR